MSQTPLQPPGGSSAQPTAAARTPDPLPPDATAPVRPVLAAGAAKRANASVIGMIMALLATLAIVVPIVLLNPAPKAGTYRPDVDASGVAAQAADVAGFAPVVPALPQGWSANYARWSGAGADHVAYWDLGVLTGHQTFIALKQSAQANPTWVAAQTKNAPVTGTRTIAGTTWELRDAKAARSLVLSSHGTTILLTGLADFTDFDTLAKATTAALQAAPTHGKSSQ